jgi:hypothetical protein
MQQRTDGGKVRNVVCYKVHSTPNDLSCLLLVWAGRTTGLVQQIGEIYCFVCSMCKGLHPFDVCCSLACPSVKVQLPSYFSCF